MLSRLFEFLDKEEEKKGKAHFFLNLDLVFQNKKKSTKLKKGGFHFGSVWTVDASTGGLGPIKDFVVEDCFSGMNSGGLSVIA